MRVAWHLPVCPAGAKMLEHCNAYDTPFYVSLKSSLKEEQAVDSEQLHSGSQHAASEQQAQPGYTAAEGAAAPRAVSSLPGVSLQAVSSSPGKAKGEEATSETCPQVSPMALCGIRALLGGCAAGSPLEPCLRGMRFRLSSLRQLFKKEGLGQHSAAQVDGPQTVAACTATKLASSLLPGR